MQSIAETRSSTQNVAAKCSAKSWSLKSVATGVLVRQLDALAEQEHCTDAEVLAHIAEIDAREEYLPLGYFSMHDYCVRRLRMSEDRALKRIRVGRLALQFPAIFPMVADGRLNLSAVLMLRPKLTPENATELLAAAALKTNAEIELLLARRFSNAGPQEAAPSLALNPGIPEEFEVEVAARPPLVPSSALNDANPMGPLAAHDRTAATAAPQVHLHARFTPVSAECATLEGQLRLSAYEQFLRLKALLGHKIPSGNAALVIEHALKLAADLLQKQKFGKGVRTRPRDGEPNRRYVPDAIRQAVSERDGGRCTFEGPDGTRCEADTQLEFDHKLPLAQGGKTTVENLRLLCRRHNQFEAKRSFGADFIRARQEHARADAARERARRNDKAGAPGLDRVSARGSADADHTTTVVLPNPHTTAPDRDVIPWLRSLRLSLVEARRGAEFCAHIPDAPLEVRVRTALQGLGRARAHLMTHAPSACS